MDDMSVFMDKKRAILYFLPRDQYFKVAFVFGQRAVNVILESGISQALKIGLEEARVFAEGRGIRIDMREASIADIERLTEIKLAN